MVDKFTFKVSTDRLYTADHLWVKQTPGGVRIGLSDYLQQRSGDVAFAEPMTARTELVPGDELAVIETRDGDVHLPGTGAQASEPRPGSRPKVQPGCQLR